MTVLAISQYASQIEDISEAQAFVSAVASSDSIFNSKPSDATVAEMLHYILEKEISTTTISGSYSGDLIKLLEMQLLVGSLIVLGMLQIQFLAGAVGVAIQQHVEEDDQASLSKLTLFPCCFSDDVTIIHIMWVKMTRQSRDMNHIVPLLPEGTVMTDMHIYMFGCRHDIISERGSSNSWCGGHYRQHQGGVHPQRCSPVIYMGTVQWTGSNVGDAAAGSTVPVLG